MAAFERKDPNKSQRVSSSQKFIIISQILPLFSKFNVEITANK